MIIQRAINIVRRHGLLYFVKRIAELIRRAGYGKLEVLLYIDIGADVFNPDELPDGMRLGHAETFADVPDSVLAQAYAQKTRKIVEHYMRHFFSRGATFWYLRVNDELVGVCWSTVNTDGLFYFSPLAADDAIIEATEVYPQYRGNGYNPLMIRAVFGELAARGIRRVYMSSKVWNTPSLRSLAKTGLRELGYVRRFTLFGKRMTLWNR